MRSNKLLIRRFLLSLIILLFSLTFVGAKDLGLLKEFSNTLAEISEKVKPSVVSVVAIKKIKIPTRGLSPFFDDPFFDELRRFFGPDLFPFPRYDFPEEREYEQSGLGSGVIVSEEGYILTNNHVVAGADEIKVTLSDEREFDAQIIGRDPETDIAVIKINAKNLPTATLGDSDKVKVGEWVLAIGNPFGLQYTVTSGIISAVGRANIGITQYEDFIQTDAAINPGNSGGPLVNLDGEVIGINTAIFSRSGGYMGVGFAIPINMAEKVMEQLIKTGKVVRGWLGVTIQDLTKELAEKLGLEQMKAVVVRQVKVGSPADKAGIKSNDIILEIDGKPMKTAKEVMQSIATIAPGTKVEIVILREKKRIPKIVEISERPSMERGIEERTLKDSKESLGLEVSELTTELAERYNLKEKKGVVITRIIPGSPAYYAELKEGDLIIQVNGEEIENMKDYERAIKDAMKRKKIKLTCLRYYMGGYWRFTTILHLE